MANKIYYTVKEVNPSDLEKYKVLEKIVTENNKDYFKYIVLSIKDLKESFYNSIIKFYLFFSNDPKKKKLIDKRLNKMFHLAKKEDLDKILNNHY